MKRTKNAAKGRGRPTADQSLTPREVAQAALEVVESVGADSLTMRVLAERLGVQATALYNHFPDKVAILDAVAELSFERLAVPSVTGPWHDRIKSLCRNVRNLALAHPNLFRVAMTRPMPPASALPLVESALAALAESGLAPRTQAVAYESLRLYLLAFCLQEIDRRHQQGHTAELTRRAAPYPHASIAMPLLFSIDPGARFEEGLDRLLGLGRDRPTGPPRAGPVSPRRPKAR